MQGSLFVQESELGIIVQSLICRMIEVGQQGIEILARLESITLPSFCRQRV